MNCGMECVKYLLFVFNFIFALGGLAILVCGVLVRLALSDLIESNIATDIHISVPAIVLIIIGAIIFIIAFFGCCGAIRESHCMIITFAVLLLTLLVIQIAIASWIIVKFKGEELRKEINDHIQKSVNNYYSNATDQEVVNAVQYLASCCGYTSYNDYLNINHTIPYTCCKKSENETCSIKDVENVPGCKDELYDILYQKSKQLGGLAIGIAAVELIGIIFSFCLANSIRNVQRRGYKV